MTTGTAAEVSEPAFSLPDPMPATVWEALGRTVGRRGGEVAVRRHDGGPTWTWAELDDEVRRLARAFGALGLRRGDTVALLLRNRPEFYAVDLALVRLGVVPFSLYATSSPEQHQHVLDDSGAVAVLAERGLRAALAAVRLPQLRIQLEDDEEARTGGWTPLADVVDQGATFDLDAVPPPRPADLLTLIYTSGTTGPPKGVMITHRNLLATAAATLTAQRIAEGSTVVSWLPLAHVGGRASGYVTAVVQGLEIVTVDDPRQVIEAVRSIRPRFFSAPPRTFEKLRSGFDSWVLGLDDEHRRAVLEDLAASEERVDLEQAGRPVPEDLRRRTDAARSDSFGPWKSAAGLDRLRAAVVATAPNPGPVMRFFHAIGIPMGEAYGLSESAALGTASGADRIRIGTVGTASLGMELRLAADGEILLRGPAVMTGYLNRPEATAEALDADGWLHSGDLGELDDEGYLRVVGRKKEIIVNASGKNISPVTVESAVASQSPLIGQVCCVGDGRPYVVALVVLDREYAAGWAAQHALDPADLEGLAGHERLVAEVTRAVEAANARLNRPEQVKRFRIVADEWLPGRELTPTSKMRRAEIARRYAVTIEELYA